jgi:hypothetical protein
VRTLRRTSATVRAAVLRAEDRIAMRSPPSALTPWVVGACRDPQARSAPDVSAPVGTLMGQRYRWTAAGVRHTSGFRSCARCRLSGAIIRNPWLLAAVAPGCSRMACP